MNRCTLLLALVPGVGHLLMGRRARGLNLLAFAATMAAVVDVKHLAKHYGDFVAVEDVSFTVEDGEIFGILGPNGAGKTTTVECLQGLRKADGGELRVLGHDPRQVGELFASGFHGEDYDASGVSDLTSSSEKPRSVRASRRFLRASW